VGSNPINLVVRFILEMAGLVALGWWGWNQGEGILRFMLTLGIPFLTAVLWGTFAVPYDPSRNSLHKLSCHPHKKRFKSVHFNGTIAPAPRALASVNPRITL